MNIKTLRNTCLALLLAATGASAQTAGPVATKELLNEIAEKDRMLFDAIFNTCDIQALAALVTDDFEMFHDKGGLVSTSGAQFVGQRLEARASGELRPQADGVRTSTKARGSGALFRPPARRLASSDL